MATIFALFFIFHSVISQQVAQPYPYQVSNQQEQQQQSQYQQQQPQPSYGYGYPGVYQGYPYYYWPPQYYYPPYGHYIPPGTPWGQQGYYVYPYVYNTHGQTITNPNSNPDNNHQLLQIPQSNTTLQPETNIKDKYKNVKTEIIDVDPQHFNYLMNQMKLQQNNAPSRPYVQQVQQQQQQIRPSYIVKVNSNSYNQTSVPNTLKKHEVQHKTYSFRKTYVISPEDRNKVINLSFVNGVPVNNTSPSEGGSAEETTTVKDAVTTTENENPVTVGGWLGF